MIHQCGTKRVIHNRGRQRGLEEFLDRPGYIARDELIPPFNELWRWHVLDK